MDASAAELRSVLPFEAINAHFSGRVDRKELGLADLGEIMKLCPKDVLSLALNCAVRAKQLTRPDLDMIPLAPYLQSSDPQVIHALSRILGQKALSDIYCCRCEVAGDLVASLLIAEVYPRDLYVGMVTFADPSKPIPPGQRKSVLQKYRGLGLLGEFVRRLEACAAARGCDNITLVANESSQVGLFQKYGFAIDDNPMAQAQAAQGQAIPMHKAVVGTSDERP